MGDMRATKVNRIKRTGYSRDGVEILEVGVMVETVNGWKEFKGRAGPDKVELESDPDDMNLHPDDLKDLIAGAAHEWDKAFEDWSGEIKSRDEPVGDG